MDQRYKFVRQLGQGGQGRVFLVEDLFRQNRKLALKRVTNEQRAELALEFDRLSRLRYPSLARAYDFGHDDEGPFFTSEYVDGADIVTWSKTADEESVCLAMASLLRGLALLHDRDLVHGDVSAQNVLMTTVDKKPVPKLLDLGGACRPGQQGSGSTAGFVAPELLTGRGALLCSDLYSFGVLLSLVLLNKHPFGNCSASATIKRQLAGDIELPDPQTSPLVQLISDLVSLDPGARPTSARQTLKRLTDATDIPLAFDIKELQGGDLPAPRLVGRTKQLAQLTAIMDRLDEPGAGRVLQIEGPVGSGRTSLMSELIRQAQLSGMTVIGRAGGATQPEHFFRALVKAAGENIPPDTKKLLGPWLGQGASIDSKNASWSSAVGFAVSSLVDLATQNRPALIVLDDLNISGQLIEDVAKILARSLDPGRPERPRAVLMVTGCKGDELVPGGQAVDLEPLEANSIEQLVSSMMPGMEPPKNLASAIHLASCGWPGPAEELVRTAVGPDGSDDIESLTARMVDGLGPEAQKLLAVFDLLDKPVPGALASKMANKKLVDDLVRKGFIFETTDEDGPGLMASGSVAKACASLVDKTTLAKPARKLALDLVQFQRLATAANLWARIGDNTLAGKTFGELALACKTQGDLLSAGQWFERALDLLDTAEASSLAREAVFVWRSLARFKLAIGAVDKADFSANEKSRLLAELILDSGNHKEALEFASLELKKFPSDFILKSIIAAAKLQLGRYEQCVTTAKKALKNADPSGAVELSAAARIAQIGGLANVYLGNTKQAASLFARATRDFERSSDLLGQLKVSANLGLLYRRLGELAKARMSYDRAVELSQKIGDRPREGLHRMNRATIAQSAGDYASAYDDYMTALDIAVVLGNEFARAQVEINAGQLLSDLGNQTEASKMTASAMQRCRGLGQERLEVRALLASGIAALRGADPVRAQRRLSEARRRFSAAGNEMGRVQADVYLSELHLQRGDNQGASKLAQATADAAVKQELPRENARALTVLARACEARDEFEEALKYLDEARLVFEHENAPDDLWRIDCHRARILEITGKTSEAGKMLERAQKGLTEILKGVPEAFKESFKTWAEAGQLTHMDKEEIVGSPDRWSRDLELLMEINRELTRELDPKRLLSLIMERAVELTGAERGIVIMPRGGKLEPVISHQISDEVEVSFSRSVAEKVVAERRSILAVDALDDDRFMSFVSVNTMKLRSILAVPLSIHRKAVGVIYLDSRLRSGVFSDADYRLLEAFGSQAAIALETARLVSENKHRCSDLETANDEISALSKQLEQQLENKEAKLKRVGALLQKTQSNESSKLQTTGLVGRSEAMQKVAKLVSRIALADVPIYIFGGSGSGKELVAKAIHAASERWEMPFVPVNCGALPSQLLASELFGHIKGAFTGAVTDRPGLFELADKGILFLDEVADMDPEMQIHLLRVLQDGKFRRLGGNDEISTDVRVITASNRDLEKEVAGGRFREDLFYRLNVVRIDVPPLEDRREDIPLLVDFFIQRHFEGSQPSPEFSKEAMDLLIGAQWPGNVRELENEVLRALTMSTKGQPIIPEDLSPRITGDQETSQWTGDGTLKERVDNFEKIIISRILSQCQGNATHSAKLLGISRAGLYKKLDKHGLIGKK